MAVMRSSVMLLASGAGGGAAVDLGTGALVRLHWVVPPAAPFEPYDVVDVDLLDGHDELPFPRDSVYAARPERTGSLGGRRAERLLRGVIHPDNRPLLGAPTAKVAYWTLRDDQPSVAVLAPSAGPVVERDGRLKLRCRFRWRRIDHDLPLADPVLDERLSHPTAVHLAGGTLDRALGWHPHRLVVVLAPPRDGQCAKVVTGMLPKP